MTIMENKVNTCEYILMKVRERERDRPTLSYSKIPFNKCTKNDGNRKSPLGKHHSTNSGGKYKQQMLKLMGKSIINRIFA